MIRGSKSLIVLIMIFLVIQSIPPTSTTRENPQLVSYGLPTSSFTEHGIIVITNDSQFESQGWDGLGTEEDPYVISDLNITSDDVCISISNTRVYFKIQNCLIESLSSWGSHGIVFSNVVNGLVTNCTIKAKNYGVYLTNSPNCTLSYVSSGNNYRDGIHVSDSDYCMIDYCTVYHNGRDGIFLDHSDYCAVTDCYASYNDEDGYYYFGIYLESCDYCQINNSIAYDNTYYGIGLSGSDHNLLYNNTASEHYEDGFFLYDCRYNILIENYAHDNHMAGFWLREGDSNELYNNTSFSNDRYGYYFRNHGSGTSTGNNASWNAWDGFYLWYSHGERLDYNFIYHNGDGIDLWDCGSCTIYHNDILSNGANGITIDSSPSTINSNYFDSNGYSGINLDYTGHCSILNNLFLHDGIFLMGDYDELSHSIVNNTVNGKLIGYWYEQDNFEIDASNYGQVFLLRCNNVIVTNGYFFDVSIGLHSFYANELIIRNCTVVDVHVKGFFLFNVDDSLIIQNQIYRANQMGMHAAHCDGSTFENNSAYDCGECGFYMFAIDDVIIKNNIAGGSKGTGTWDGHGFNILSIDGAVISGNLAFDNQQRGFFFYDSDLNEFVNNTSCENEYGIYLWDNADSNSIYQNQFGWNTGSNAYDEGSGNKFDDTVSIGNNWSQYIPPGQLSISGPSSAVDHFPGNLDRVGPFVSTTPDILIDSATEGINCTWITHSTYPHEFQISVNGILLEEDVWNSPILSWPLDDFTPGLYLFEITVADNASRTTTDIVRVIIVDRVSPTISHPDDIEYIEGSSGNVIIWIAFDEYPESYSVFIDNILDREGEWISTEIVVDIDNLSAGIHNVTLVVFDGSGNSASDAVFVNVKEAVTMTTTTTSTSATILGDYIIFIAIGLIGIIAVTVLFVKIRK